MGTHKDHAILKDTHTQSGQDIKMWEHKEGRTSQQGSQEGVVLESTESSTST